MSNLAAKSRCRTGRERPRQVGEFYVTESAARSHHQPRTLQSGLGRLPRGGRTCAAAHPSSPLARAALPACANNWESEGKSPINTIQTRRPLIGNSVRGGANQGLISRVRGGHQPTFGSLKVPPSHTAAREPPTLVTILLCICKDQDNMAPIRRPTAARPGNVSCCVV